MKSSTSPKKSQVKKTPSNASLKKSSSPIKKNESNLRASTNKGAKEENKSKGMITTKTSNLSQSDSGKNANISPSKVKLDIHK